MKKLRLILWIMVAVFTGVATYAWLTIGNGPRIVEAPPVKLGGPFELVNQDGVKVTEEIFKNRNHALFFGFTNCPDICPTTLLDVSGWLKNLGDDGDKVDFYFITVDPERDTAEFLNDYVSAFDERITGLTGTPEEIAKVVSSYKVYSQRVALDDDDYTMDHSAFVMLFNRDGQFKGTIAYNEAKDTALAKLRRLIENG